MTLPIVITPGDSGHIDHHEDIHTLLGDLDSMSGFLAGGVKQGTLAARPAAAAGNQSFWYYADDVDQVFLSDGAAWHQAGFTNTEQTWSADQYFTSGSPWRDVVGYGADPTGVSDSTAAIQAAITAAGIDGVVFFPKGTYAISGITLDTYTKLIGNGSRLIPTGNNQTLVTVPDSVEGLQTQRTIVIRDLTIDGDSNLGRTGIIGISSGNHASFRTYNLVVTKCDDTGFEMLATQFSSHYSMQVYSCGVGVKIVSVSGTGGGNSNSFYDPQIIANTVGVFINNLSVFPQTDNYMYNATIIQNTVCGLAVFGLNSRDIPMTIYGGAPEANATGAATATVDSKTVKKATIYIVTGTVALYAVTNEDATANPWALLETNATLQLVGHRGYGLTGGQHVQADSTSRVALSGAFGGIGQINNVDSYPSSFESRNTTKMIGVPLAVVTDSIRNDFTGSALAPNGTHTTATSDGFTWDSEQGYVKTVQHAASAGTQDANRISFGDVISVATGVTSDVLVSILVRASVACTYVLAGYPAIAAATISLPAGKWVRVILFATSQSAGAAFTLVGYPTDSTGPEVRFAKLQVIAAPTNSVEQQQLHSAVVAHGLVKPNNPGLVPYRQLSAAPTVGTWPAGAIVLNSAPAAGGTLGWVCVTAGTPGTWKTFGAISA